MNNAFYLSPIGKIILESEGDFLTRLYFDDDFKGELSEKPSDVMKSAFKWLDIFFSGKNPDFTPEFKLCASPFQAQVLKLTMQIPFGKTKTYGEIARQIAFERKMPKMSAQAVGGALKNNPLALIVPCHRVVASGGKLSGYAFGTDKKAWLLKMEEKSLMPAKSEE